MDATEKAPALSLARHLERLSQKLNVKKNKKSLEAGVYSNILIIVGLLFRRFKSFTARLLNWRENMKKYNKDGYGSKITTGRVKAKPNLALR